MKWLIRILAGLLGVVALLVLLVVGIVVGDSIFGTDATAYTNVTYPATDETTLNGYLAQPEGEGVFPAVIMVHEWWGLNAEIIELADEMAESGYVVLAPDTYRGPSTAQIPRALYLRLSVPEDRVDADMQAAFDYLAGLPQVDATSIGVIGFCYGGGVALRHAINNPQIAATINLYGDTVSDPQAFGALLQPEAGPVLGIFGEEDAQIPLDEVDAFEDALAAAGIDHTVTVYEGVGHAFVQPDAIAEASAPRQAWMQILSFFGEHLQGLTVASTR